MLEEIVPSVRNVVVRQTYEGWRVPLRQLDAHEIVMVNSSGGILTERDKHIPIYGNYLLYFYPGLTHGMHVESMPHMDFIAVKFVFRGDKDVLPLPTVSHIQNPIRLKGLFTQIADVFRKKPYLYEWHQNIIMQQILFEIFTLTRQNIAPINVARMKTILDYIHNDPYRTFTITELSGVAGIQKSYFISLFKEVTGKTPIRYIIDLKLEHSKGMLLNSSLGIKEVAYSCGFSDEFYYSKMFKLMYGISPKKFRYSSEL